MGIRINPSILSADFGELGAQMELVNNADFIHVDVMDNHFVPNLTMGPPIVSRVHQIAPLPCDVHLMMTEPERWAPAYVEMGAHTVSFHAEATDNSSALVDELHKLGTRAGLAFRPITDPEPFFDVIEKVDLVLVMTVEPGFGGQVFQPEMMAKVQKLAEFREKNGLDFWIEVDGGINAETIGIASEHGADTFVAGSSVYGHENPREAVEILRKQALANNGKFRKP